MDPSLKILVLLTGAYCLFQILLAKRSLDNFNLTRIMRPLSDGLPPIPVIHLETVGDIPRFPQAKTAEQNR